MSSENELLKKLTLIQSELKAPKNQFNKFGKYNYRSCEDILISVKPLLSKHNCNLVLTDEVKDTNGTIYIEAKSIFSLGSEKIEVKAQAGININKKGSDISQSFGASSSYARKYCLSGLFLLDDTKDADSEDKPEKTPIPTVKPELIPNTIAWDGAVEHLKNCTVTIEAIEKKYSLKLHKDELIAATV